MSVEVRIQGADKLRKVADDLRQASRKDLTRELRRGIRDAVKPFSQAVHQQTRLLPSGYGPVLERALRVEPRVLTGGEDASVRIKVSARGQREERDVAAVDKGLLRHPVFGDREAWVAQRVRPGLVEQPRRQLESRVVREVEAAVDRVAEQIERG